MFRVEGAGATKCLGGGAWKGLLMRELGKRTKTSDIG